jgi:hypothetical protein
MASTPEGKTKDLIKKWEKKNQDLLKLWMIIPSRFGASVGISDFIGIAKGGKFVAIEAKADGKKDTVTPLQQIFIDVINKFGGVAGVVSNQEDLTAFDIELRSRCE